MQAIEEQQFEVSNLLFTLPPREWKSALENLVRDPATKNVRGGPVEALVEYVIGNEVQSMPLSQGTGISVFECEFTYRFLI